MKTRYTGPLVYCRHYDHPRVVELRTVYSSNLPLHHTRSTFVHKQNALAKLGCVEVVARIMMAVDGDLADEALEVMMIEILVSRSLLSECQNVYAF